MSKLIHDSKSDKKKSDKKKKQYHDVVLPTVDTDSENDSRNQTSLELGSRTYKEFVHDNQMSSNTDFDSVKTADADAMNKKYVHDKVNKIKNRKSAIDAKTRNMQVKSEMSRRNAQHQKEQADRLNQRKAYAHIKKDDLSDDAMQYALEEAYETETKSDDEAVKHHMPKTLETIKYNDGVTEDDYLKATSKAARKYL